jgi:hypothetical protein
MCLDSFLFKQSEARCQQKIFVTTHINMLVGGSILGAVWGIAKSVNDLKKICLQQKEEMQKLKQAVSKPVDDGDEASICSEEDSE